MFKYILFLQFITMSSLAVYAQQIEPENGVQSFDNTLYAITKVKVVLSADEVIENGTILFQNGRIVKVGKVFSLPKNAVEIERPGATVYPSFIEPYSDLGIKKAVSLKKGRSPQLNSLNEGPYYWNEAIHPQVNAFDLFDKNLTKSKKELINNGFGVVSAHQTDGIIRGTSVVYSLGDLGQKQEVISNKGAQHYSFSKGVSKQTYPSSQMGVIALMRQFLYDFEWYFSSQRVVLTNLSFLAMQGNQSLPQIFEVGDKLELLRVRKIAVEFDLPFTIFGGGDEYQRIEEISAEVDTLIIPLNFPKAYDITDPFIARYIHLSDLKHWELAPYNPYVLHKNKVKFAFSLYKTKVKKEFLSQVRAAVKHGLPQSEALKALTVHPATILGIEKEVGTLAKGKLANFIIAKGNIFEDGEIIENWIRGVKHQVKPFNELKMDGDYTFNIGGAIYEGKLKFAGAKSSGTITSFKSKLDSATQVTSKDTMESKMVINQSGQQFSAVFKVYNQNQSGLIQLNGSVHEKLGVIDGNALLANGEWVKWNAIKQNKAEDKKKTFELKIDTSALKNMTYPFMAFGFDSLPESQSYFIKNVTIWTNEKQGIIKNGNVFIKNGKIEGINRKINTFSNNTIIIDGAGMHLTSGIIDEHSHIAISKGVNEGGQANSAEVSIRDVVRSNDINIYRQLAGGVTCSQLLHGSANPIGGQSALIKLKWGFLPAQMLVENAPGFIKFALGENVKQSNWGDHNRVRFPQTRMGVEQVYYDAFTRAREYEKAWKHHLNLKPKEKEGHVAPRKDLEMEVVLEILKSERFITCHSYIQSEILMLMRVADSMQFTINTFTHILEGYKLADIMKEHGAGASTFSDWWAYKFEVNEAIPYNAAILNKMGIVTAINSDDAEMGRRLNHEAAKIVKYGGVSEEDAWKMITLSPAKLLRVDDRMGSVKVGKDADIVLWSTNPLSVQAKVEKTFVDGLLLYDAQKTIELQKRDQLERKRLVEKMLVEKLAGKSTQKPVIKVERHYHCDTEGE
ncbi:amidohydrolase [Putridiphycobacter roseus]|uniref:Amidohydrolase n=2 Tax=Putridiphycobacter roseus TaxID=2219161 RepID=A0A2W1N9V8_9FLAO|nr:amidohydrolase [Putridiphycobacter roseus]